MKKTIAVLSALMTAAVFAGAENDINISFSTPGPDKYADGSTVLDNEYYALVWTPADGGEQTVVCALKAARNGRCVPVLFTVLADDAKNYKNGKFGVYLLDTRVFATDEAGDTKVTGLAGKIDVDSLNAKVAVADGIVSSEGAIVTADASAGVSAESYDLDALEVPAPRVTKIEVENANVVVTVADTVPFVAYTLQSGADVKNFTVPADAKCANGNKGGEIKLVTPKKDGAQFFKVSTTTVK
ncbi:MAG: hypothetical protein J6Q49_10170 [Kiritimatiellae bacterium]|nr:hypothetical protein [Kiritimatiellia bacterium]